MRRIRVVRAELLADDAMVGIGRANHLAQLALRAPVGLGDRVERAAAALVVSRGAAEQRRDDRARSVGQVMSESGKFGRLSGRGSRHGFPDLANCINLQRNRH